MFSMAVRSTYSHSLVGSFVSQRLDLLLVGIELLEFLLQNEVGADPGRHRVLLIASVVVLLLELLHDFSEPDRH